MTDFSNCKRVFYEDFELRVHEDVYEPAEDSFALAKHVPAFAKGNVLDMGTGSGLLAIVASNEGTTVLGVDVNPLAVENARFNSELNGSGCKFSESNLFTELESKFDLIIFNPPYLPTGAGEAVPGHINKAWDGGSDGREVIDRFLADAPDFLSPTGAILTLASSLSGIKETVEALSKEGLKTEVLEEVSMFQEKLAVIVARK
ncbi:MAG: methyltransferase [Candidatus Burarchaeum sp.]|nr:HemK2/MTQ2 family protein methyltransferase [Candidatus Burarchaeum sp.]MDO8339803.1 methyltransferase [Candidatus Burarchaeum sp.]